jgi:hypothetical protein
MPKHPKLFVPDIDRQSTDPPKKRKIPLYSWEKTLALIPECFQKAIHELREQLDSEDEKLRCRGIEMMLKYVTKLEMIQAYLTKDIEQAQTSAKVDEAELMARDIAAIGRMGQDELIKQLFNEVQGGEWDEMGQALNVIVPKSMRPKRKRGRAKTS